MQAGYFIETLISKLSTVFATPEEPIIKQGDDPEAMYFISQGECIVNIKNRYENTKIAHKLLVEGDHFGCISLLYNCPTTSSVTSRNFNTMASLNHANFRNILIEFPNYKRHLTRHVMSLKDENKSFILKTFSKIKYLNGVGSKALHQLLYSVRRVYLEEGHNIIRPGNIADELFVIEIGNVEVYTMVEGTKFVLEYLNCGSIINHRAFLMNDLL